MRTNAVLPHRWARLLQMAAAWLAAALLMQALQGAMALGAGPRHAHHVQVQAAGAGGHLHANLERHHHRADDASVVRAASTDDSLDAANLALTLALALMAFGMLRVWPGHRSSARATARAWFWSTRGAPPLRRPPRPA